jgi:hypothetical protein
VDRLEIGSLIDEMFRLEKKFYETKDSKGIGKEINLNIEARLGEIYIIIMKEKQNHEI